MEKDLLRKGAVGINYMTSLEIKNNLMGAYTRLAQVCSLCVFLCFEGWRRRSGCIYFFKDKHLMIST